MEKTMAGIVRQSGAIIVEGFKNQGRFIGLQRRFHWNGSVEVKIFGNEVKPLEYAWFSPDGKLFSYE